MTTKQTSTHVMVPPELKGRLKALSDSSRVPQAEYLRRAASVAVTSGDILVALAKPKPESEAQFVSIVFRISEETLTGLQTLSSETRIKQGEYMRLALEAVVSQHEAARKVGAA